MDVEFLAVEHYGGSFYGKRIAIFIGRKFFYKRVFAVLHPSSFGPIDIISTVLTDNSTIFDALSLVRPFCSFLVDSVIKKYEDISQDDIEATIGDFWEFLDFPNMTIINNTTITENKDLNLVIKDKYNLCNIKISKDDLEEENLDKLINTAKIICNSYYLERSQITLEDIKFVLQVNKLFGEEE